MQKTGHLILGGKVTKNKEVAFCDDALRWKRDGMLQ